MIPTCAKTARRQNCLPRLPQWRQCRCPCRVTAVSFRASVFGLAGLGPCRPKIEQHGPPGLRSEVNRFAVPPKQFECRHRLCRIKRDEPALAAIGRRWMIGSLRSDMTRRQGQHEEGRKGRKHGAATRETAQLALQRKKVERVRHVPTYTGSCPADLLKILSEVEPSRADRLNSFEFAPDLPALVSALNELPIIYYIAVSQTGSRTGSCPRRDHYRCGAQDRPRLAPAATMRGMRCSSRG